MAKYKEKTMKLISCNNTPNNKHTTLKAKAILQAADSYLAS
jgi:hypothetical protein